MPIGFDHDLRDSFSVAVRHAGLKQIAHRVDKDQLGRSPGEWLGQLLGNNSKIETLLVWMSFHAAKPLSESLGIAMLAARTDFRAATDGIPGGIGPFDLGAY